MIYTLENLIGRIREDYDSKAWYNLMNVQYQDLLAYGFFTGKVPLFTINKHRLMLDGKVIKIE